MSALRPPNAGGPLPTLARENEPPELTEQDIVRWVVSGVIFKAGALEVLHGVGLPILQPLFERFGDGVAELRQPTVLLPVRIEQAVDIVPGLGEILRGV